MSKLQFTLPFLRFKGFNEKIISCKLEKIVNNLEEFNFFSNLFWDAPSILKSKPILFNGQDFKKSPENSIIFIKDGSNAGTFTYCDKNSYIATTCDYFCVKINALYVYYFIKSKEKHIKNNLITGETIPHLYKKHLFSIIINFVNDKNEQIKISKFFSLLDKHIELWKRKLQLYLLKKKFIYDKIFKTSNEEIKLKNIFVEINEKTEYKNVMLASVGKNGIRLKSEVFHKINVKSDHKVKIAEKNYLIVGMGSKQIDSHINLLFDNIGVSVAYKTFKLINELYNPKYLDMYLNHFNNYFSSLFMIVSARQGKTVNINDWFNFKISIHDKKNRDNIAIFGYKIDLLISKINKKINLLKNQRQYYLDKLFI